MVTFTNRLRQNSGKKNPWFYVSMVLTAVIIVMMTINNLEHQPNLTISTTTTTTGSSNSMRQQSQKKKSSSSSSYTGSIIENYLLDHATELGYHIKDSGKFNDPTSLRPEGCAIFKDAKTTTPEMYKILTQFRSELKDYTQKVNDFTLPDGVKDIRLHLNNGANENENDNNNTNNSICDKLELHPDGLPGIFKSGALSFGGAHNDDDGYMEPLFPPLRDPEFCFGAKVLTLNYIVHDFAHWCRHKLKRHSRTIFIDMGASLDFYGHASPAIYITTVYRKFGIVFDHIYAYEVTAKDPSTVFEQIPEELLPSYHWMNVGVKSDPTHKLNPLKMLKTHALTFTPDDFIVVKLDIDQPRLEIPLATQILNDDTLADLIDVFYFEHHVHLKDLQRHWTSTMSGTVGDSLKMFRTMREKGIAAHYWV